MMDTLTLEPSRVKRLKAGTHSDHDSVDNLVMASRPFESRERYGLFLQLQHRFQGAIAGLYDDATLNSLLPGLQARGHFAAVRADLQDLGLALPPPPAPALVGSPYAALGWLYCSEGSNLGAAILFKATRALELDESFGARHLAAHADGRMPHWRAFTQQLDALELNDEQEQQVIAGGRAAFEFYRVALRQVFGA